MRMGKATWQCANSAPCSTHRVVDQQLEDIVGIPTPEVRTRVVRLLGICPGIFACMPLLGKEELSSLKELGLHGEVAGE
jgi:hypothetical protein